MVIRVMTDAVLHSRNHILIAFQESAHILQKSQIIFRKASLSWSAVLIKSSRIHSFCHDLRSCKQSVLHDQVKRCPFSQNMKAVHMIILFPELHCTKCH